jgi:hypothetical protein
VNKVTKKLLLFNLDNHQYLYYKPWDDEWTHNPLEAMEFSNTKELVKYVEEDDYNIFYKGISFEIKPMYYTEEIDEEDE